LEEEDHWSAAPASAPLRALALVNWMPPFRPKKTAESLQASAAIPPDPNLEGHGPRGEQHWLRRLLLVSILAPLGTSLAILAFQDGRRRS